MKLNTQILKELYKNNFLFGKLYIQDIKIINSNFFSIKFINYFPF